MATVKTSIPNGHLRWKDEIYLPMMVLQEIHIAKNQNLPTSSSVCYKKTQLCCLLFICFNKRFHLHLNRTPNQFMIFHIFFSVWSRPQRPKKLCRCFCPCLFDIKSPIKSHLVLAVGRSLQVIFVSLRQRFFSLFLLCGTSFFVNNFMNKCIEFATLIYRFTCFEIQTFIRTKIYGFELM